MLSLLASALLLPLCHPHFSDGSCLGRIRKVQPPEELTAGHRPKPAAWTPKKHAGPEHGQVPVSYAEWCPGPAEVLEQCRGASIWAALLVLPQPDPQQPGALSRCLCMLFCGSV